MPKVVTHPLAARLVLLAAAAALAACLVFAMVVAEQRDVDLQRDPAGAGRAVPELRMGEAAAAPADQLRAVSTAR